LGSNDKITNTSNEYSLNTNFIPSLQKMMQDGNIDMQRSLVDFNDKNLKPMNINLLDRAKLFLKVTFAQILGEKAHSSMK
jgi:hypothetical protein